MFGTILVALDGSSHGRAASQMAIDLAKRLGSTLHGLYVIDSALLRGSLLHDLSGALGLEPQFHLSSQLEQLLETQARNVLAELEERCIREEVSCRVSSQIGDVISVLAEEADLADLVVLGKRGGSYDLNPAHSSVHGVARQLMRQSPTSLLLTGVEVLPLTRVVVGFDGSHGSCRALKDATRLAVSLSLPLVICHVHPNDASLEGRALIEAQRYLEPHDLDVRYVEGEGDTVETLLECMLREQADMLCVGYHGSSRWREIFSGHAPEALASRLNSLLWVAK